MPFRGAIDTPQHDQILGWAVSPDGSCCRLQIVVNNGAPVFVDSDGARADLAKGGVSKGQGGFTVNVGSSIRPGVNTIELRFPDDTHVSGSPIVRLAGANPELPKFAGFRGHVDMAGRTTVRGWALTREGDPCDLVIVVNQHDVIRVTSDLPRPDLLRGGVSRGKGGFEVAIGEMLRPGDNEIAVLLPDSTHVTGSPAMYRIEVPAEAATIAPAVEEPAQPEQPEPAAATAGVGGDSAPKGPVRLSFETGAGADAGEPAKPPRPAPAKPVKKPRPPELVTGPPKMPSLSELDELSLDDLALAVAAGRIAVSPSPEPIAPANDEAEIGPSGEEAVDRGDAPASPKARRGFFGRLFRR